MEAHGRSRCAWLADRNEKTNEKKWTGGLRSGVTDLSVDPNELLGVTLGPRRQLHVSQGRAVLHAA